MLGVAAAGVRCCRIGVKRKNLFSSAALFTFFCIFIPSRTPAMRLTAPRCSLPWLRRCHPQEPRRH